MASETATPCVCESDTTIGALRAGSAKSGNPKQIECLSTNASSLACGVEVHIKIRYGTTKM